MAKKATRSSSPKKKSTKTPKILVEAGAEINPANISNEIGSVIPYEGNREQVKFCRLTGYPVDFDGYQEEFYNEVDKLNLENDEKFNPVVEQIKEEVAALDLPDEEKEEELRKRTEQVYLTQGNEYQEALAKLHKEYPKQTTLPKSIKIDLPKTLEEWKELLIKYDETQAIMWFNQDTNEFELVLADRRIY